jgi:hypothetical protein
MESKEKEIIEIVKQYIHGTFLTTHLLRDFLIKGPIPMDQSELGKQLLHLLEDENEEKEVETNNED